MYLSIASNIINVAGNCIGVFWLHAGVAGVAWPSLLARMFSAVVITFFCFSEKNPVRYGKAWIFRLDGSLQKIILRIAVPNGIESGIFQLVKVALSSVAALFGTYQIAANGVAQSIWSVASLVASTMGPVFTTIGVRLVFSILFAIVLHMGVVGIACAMCLDWVVRGVIFWLRFRQGKWKNYRVI